MKKLSLLTRATIIVSTVALNFPFSLFTVNAASLTAGSVLLSDSRPSTASVSYTIQFSNITTSLTRCIKVQFSDTATGTTKPSGMVTTSATFTGTYVPTPASWTVDNSGTFTKITLAAGETPASSGPRTVILSGITNGSVAATGYFVQFSTYGNVDCATTPLDNSTIAFIYTTGQAVSATIDPTLSFSIAGVASAQSVNGATTNVVTTATTVPFGTLSSGTNAIGAQDLIIGTNANSGYTITTKYTGVLASASHNMVDWTGTNVTPTTFSAAGTEAFGYTTNDATLGTGSVARFSSNKWAAFTTSPLEVAYSATAVSETIRVGYQVGISAATPAGSYATTVIYVATPTY